MIKKTGWLGVLLLHLLILNLACGSSQSNVDDYVYIRIQNKTGQKFDSFNLGAGGRYLTSYAYINDEEITQYKRFQPILAEYRKSDIGIAGVRYLDVIYPEGFLGDEELLPGRYTFVYTLVNGEPKLTSILKD